MKLLLTAVIASISLSLAACAPTPLVTTTLPNSLQWFRDSAEQQASYEEIYRAAAESARLRSSALADNSWGVILDIDETILDNSEYQKRLVLSGRKFDAKSWDAWVREVQGTALPGAREFIDTVLDKLHGQVILVTNRSVSECPATEENLRRVSVRYSRILCNTQRDADKNPRFQQVMAGAPGFTPVNVLIWVGDGIEDFPRLTQSNSADPAQFGVRYFVLPNPMYGSWQGNPTR
jgi:5'-nucleotidase (lipoprotein e(P4) family)